jgi:hypothetical protein
MTLQAGAVTTAIKPRCSSSFPRLGGPWRLAEDESTSSTRRCAAPTNSRFTPWILRACTLSLESKWPVLHIALSFIVGDIMGFMAEKRLASSTASLRWEWNAFLAASSTLQVGPVCQITQMNKGKLHTITHRVLIIREGWAPFDEHGRW